MSNGEPVNRSEARIALQNQKFILTKLKRKIRESGAEPDIIVAKTAEIDALIGPIDTQLEILDTAPTVVPPTAEQAEQLAQAAQDIAHVVAANATVQEILDVAKQIAGTYNSGTGSPGPG